jgi:hypothetical protein
MQSLKRKERLFRKYEVNVYCDSVPVDSATVQALIFFKLVAVLLSIYRNVPLHRLWSGSLNSLQTLQSVRQTVLSCVKYSQYFMLYLLNTTLKIVDYVIICSECEFYCDKYRNKCDTFLHDLSYAHVFTHTGMIIFLIHLISSISNLKYFCWRL